MQAQSKQDLDCNIEVKKTAQVSVPADCHVSYDLSYTLRPCMCGVALNSPEHSCLPVL